MILIHYLHDIVLLSTVFGVLGGNAASLVTNHLEGGWVASPTKSTTTPSTTLMWMGKEIGGERYTIQQTPVYIA